MKSPFAIGPNDALPRFRVTVRNIFTGQRHTIPERFARNKREAMAATISWAAWLHGNQDPADWGGVSIEAVNN
jgi:hypothetical protein